MKTALTMLIEKWETEMGSYIPNAPIYSAFIAEARTFLDTEKQQIATAYENGAYDFQPSTSERDIEVTNGDGIDYFEQNYGSASECPRFRVNLNDDVQAEKCVIHSTDMNGKCFKCGEMNNLSDNKV